MDLTKLFRAQKKLDAHIEKEKGLEGVDLIDKKILALLTELGELSNEYQGFKYWKEDNEPRTLIEHLCPICNAIGTITDEFESHGCHECNGTGKLSESNPLLEEYVDCLHFILSIGNEICVEQFNPRKLISFNNNITGQFNAIFKLIGSWDKVLLLIDHNNYYVVFNNFIHLGEMLGFTWKQIEQAYYDKNKINFERQANGY